MRRTKTTFIKVLAILALVAVLAGCDITAKTAAPDPVTLGEQLTFTIDVDFDPGEPGTVVVDELPDSVEFVSAAVDPVGQCILEPPPSSENTVLCIVQNPDPVGGGAATITIVVTPTECGTFTNTAFIPDVAPPALAAEQLDTIEQADVEQLLEQIPVEEIAGVPPVIDEESVSFTVVGCGPQQEQQEPAAGGPITQETGQESESGETDLSFEVS